MKFAAVKGDLNLQAIWAYYKHLGRAGSYKKNEYRKEGIMVLFHEGIEADCQE